MVSKGVFPQHYSMGPHAPLNSLMGAFIVIKIDLLIEIGLPRVDWFIDLFTKRDLIKLLQDSFMEALAYAIGLRVSGFRFGMVNIVDGQE